MGKDNLGNFHDPDDFERDDDHGGNSGQPEMRYGNELFSKAIEILNLTETICSLLPVENGEPDLIHHQMMENATIVPAKIKGAMEMDAYSLKMENAVIIKVNMVQLKMQLWSCEAIHRVDRKYLDVLRDEIEIFRQLFIQWINSFDKENDVPDEWHLFNDPSDFPGDDEHFDPGDFDPDDET